MKMLVLLKPSVLLLLGILISRLTLGAGRSTREERKRLLAEYGKFEAGLKESLTSIFRTLRQEETCEKGDPGCGDSRSVNVFLEEYQATLESLLVRMEGVYHTIVTLMPSEFS